MHQPLRALHESDHSQGPTGAIGGHHSGSRPSNVVRYNERCGVTRRVFQAGGAGGARRGSGRGTGATTRSPRDEVPLRAPRGARTCSRSGAGSSVEPRVGHGRQAVESKRPGSLIRRREAAAKPPVFRVKIPRVGRAPFPRCTKRGRGGHRPRAGNPLRPSRGEIERGGGASRRQRGQSPVAWSAGALVPPRISAPVRSCRHPRPWPCCRACGSDRTAFGC